MRRDPIAVLGRGRAMAEALMLDHGKALRPNGGYKLVGGVEVQDTDPLFGHDEPVRCKVQARGLVAQEAEAGDRTITTVRTELHLPASTPALQRGDVWEFTAVHSESLQYVGQRLRVLGPAAGTLKTARRYQVEEVA